MNHKTDMEALAERLRLLLSGDAILAKSDFARATIEQAIAALASQSAGVPDEPKRGTDAQILFERELTCEAINGAIAFGYQNTNRPPSDDHWLAPFWKIGRKQAELEAVLSGPSSSETIHQVWVQETSSWADVTPDYYSERLPSNRRKVYYTPTFSGCPDAQADERGAIYVECRECAECGHIGINDSHPTDAACDYSCDWTGPSPIKDKCPGCGNENVMTDACPKCSGRYKFMADATIQTSVTAPKAEAAHGVPDIQPSGYLYGDYETLFECPDDAVMITGKKVGDRYTVTAVFYEEQQFEVVKMPDEESDDWDVRQIISAAATPVGQSAGVPEWKCKTCQDGELLPQYGCAPHDCFYKIGKQIGQSEVHAADTWPDNFEVDEESDGRCGTFHCPVCGPKFKSGKPLAAAPAPVSEPEQPPAENAAVRNKIAAALHYPEHWDTAAYPTLDHAAWEAIAAAKLTCSECVKQPSERGERPIEPEDIDAVAEAIQRETSVEWLIASRAAVAAIDTLIARGNHASEHGEQDCPHGVDDGACKQCYGEATSGEQGTARDQNSAKHCYFVYDPEGNGFDLYDTDAQRETAHLAAIAENREWALGVERIVSGFVTHTTMAGEMNSGGCDYAPLSAFNASAPTLGGEQRRVIEMLISLAQTAHYALDSSEERAGEDCTEFVLTNPWYRELSDALDALDALPDDKPGYALDAAGKAKWALRELRAPQPQAASAPAKAEAKCKACNGNDGDMPCAYPEGRADCLRNASAPTLDEQQWPSDHDAAIQACALMVLGICKTEPQEVWPKRIEGRIRYLLSKLQPQATEPLIHWRDKPQNIALLAVERGDPVDCDGTFACPICGKDEPHQHSSEEIAKFRTTQPQAAEPKGLSEPADHTEADREEG